MNHSLEHRVRDTALALCERPTRTGNGYLVPCPAHDDTNPSLHISPRNDGKGLLLHCFAQCSFRDIAQSLRARGIEIDHANGPLPSTPAPAPAAQSHTDHQWSFAGPQHPTRQPAMRHPAFGRPTHCWPYRTEEGIACYITRYALPPEIPGTKTYLPWSWWRQSTDRHPKLRCRMPPPPRPLYRLDQITAALVARPIQPPILLLEGEKTANAAYTLFPDRLATTWMSGTNSLQLTDFTPLAGQQVLLLPDLDPCGTNAMSLIQTQAESDGFSARTLPLWDILPRHPDEPWPRPRKWDLADLTPLRNAAEFIAKWRRTLDPDHPLSLSCAG